MNEDYNERIKNELLEARESSETEKKSNSLNPYIFIGLIIIGVLIWLAMHECNSKTCLLNPSTGFFYLEVLGVLMLVYLILQAGLINLIMKKFFDKGQKATEYTKPNILKTANFFRRQYMNETGQDITFVKEIIEPEHGKGSDSAPMYYYLFKKNPLSITRNDSTNYVKFTQNVWFQKTDDKGLVGIDSNFNPLENTKYSWHGGLKDDRERQSFFSPVPVSRVRIKNEREEEENELE